MALSHAGNNLVDQIHTYWNNIWPSEQQDTHTFQQLANTARWPAVQAKTARRLHSKAPGPDSWKGYEIAFAPQQALELAANILNSIQNGASWPTALTHWRQLHIYKPGKPESYISPTRPISIGSIWYRFWASHRIRSLQQWIITAMPPQQHGRLKKKGTHTALIPTLAAVEASSAHPQGNNTISFVGATDLSKAFDKMAWIRSIAALTRMGLVNKIINPLKDAWKNQKRWLTSANHVSKRPYPTNSLPQGDPAGPLALMAPLSEAFRRILRQIHSLYVDDRSWFCNRASTCVSIAKSWRQETAYLQLGENNSKPISVSLVPNVLLSTCKPKSTGLTSPESVSWAPSPSATNCTADQTQMKPTALYKNDKNRQQRKCFFKNISEVTETEKDKKRKNKKNKTLREMSQPEFPPESFVFFCSFLFFCLFSVFPFFFFSFLGFYF